MRNTVNRISKKQGVRQFTKFVIVGAVSTAIDWTVHSLMFNYVGPATGLNEAIRAWALEAAPRLSRAGVDPAFALLKAFSFAVATLNGFYFNRRWTFRITGKKSRERQLLKFYLVNLAGLVINTLVASRIHIQDGGTINYFMSLFFGTAASAAWNFTGHKFWTFRVLSDENEEPAKAEDD